jgi:hypothetical protein
MKPQIVVPEIEGRHNSDLKTAAERVITSGVYQDLSTIIICPTRGVIPAKVVQSWQGLMKPMNQKVVGTLFAIGMEVGEAYNQTIQMILENPGLKDFKYLLTIEEDNMPPVDGLLKLYESIEGKVDGQKYDVVGGLYWTKGEGGMPMIYGNPKTIPKNYQPQVPVPDSIQEANALGMGFNLWRLDMFKNPDLPKPWFKTAQEIIPNKGPMIMTQDIYFYEKAGRIGYRFACDTRVRVGHYDYAGSFGPEDTVW